MGLFCEPFQAFEIVSTMILNSVLWELFFIILVRNNINKLRVEKLELVSKISSDWWNHYNPAKNKG